MRGYHSSLTEADKCSCAATGCVVLRSVLGRPFSASVHLVGAGYRHHAKLDVHWKGSINAVGDILICDLVGFHPFHRWNKTARCTFWESRLDYWPFLSGFLKCRVVFAGIYLATLWGQPDLHSWDNTRELGCEMNSQREILSSQCLQNFMADKLCTNYLGGCKESRLPPTMLQSAVLKRWGESDTRVNTIS